MRKMLLVSIVLLIAAQAYAGTVTMSVTQKPGERTAYIGYTADANVSGFGLKIYTADPNKEAKITEINDYNVGECNSTIKGYGIFPGGIVIDDSNGVVTDYNTPIAPPWDPCAAGTGLDTNTIIAELGALYVDGNQPPLSGTLLSVKVDGDCNVCVTGEPIRGNVVLTDASQATMNPATVCARIALVCTVPDVVDQAEAIATTAITTAGFTLGNRTTAGHDTIIAGNVISTTPAAGATPGCGTAVDYVVSTGPCVVPDVVDQAEAVATAAITNAGFALGNRTTAYHNTIVAGNVISTTPGAGVQPCGTTVDYVVSLGREPRDYGDLPDSYRTLWASGGASHLNAAGPMLGANRDTEADGQPSANAKLDDTTGAPPDDEDGVQFWGGSAVKVTVSQACKLDAWVDFDANGNFDGPGERIFNNKAMAAGSTSLVFTVPAAAVKDTYLYSRWRVSTTGGLNYYGDASNGEVEDYNKPFISSCYGSGDPGYATWVTVGRPYCWCYPRQCHGDADGAASSTKAPFYWVTTADLVILKSAWGKTVDKLAGTDICADFNRSASSTKAPFYWVTTPDLTILKDNWSTAGKPLPDCVPGNKTPPAPPME